MVGFCRCVAGTDRDISDRRARWCVISQYISERTLRTIAGVGFILIGVADPGALNRLWTPGCVVSLSPPVYWAFTVTDGAIHMLVVLYFHPLELLTRSKWRCCFLFYEFFGVVTNLVWRLVGAHIG